MEQKYPAMFHRFKVYILSAIIVIVAFALILNKFLAYGLVILGVGFAGVLAWQLLIKQKDDEIYRLKSQLQETSRNTAALESENTELRNRKLNISEIKTVLDLGLMEVNTNFTRVWNEQSFYNDKQVKFIGALQVKIVAKYGLDLRDLRVKFDEENNEVMVANIAPKFLSFNDLNYEWKIAEVLEYRVPMIGEKFWKLSDDLEGLNSDLKEKYQQRIHEEVKNGPAEMEWVLEPLKKQVGGALEMLFDAKGRKIRILDKYDESFSAIKDYSAELN